MFRRSKSLSASAALACMMAAGAWAEEPTPSAVAGSRDSAVWAFGAWMTDNDWRQIATLDDVGFRDAYLAGAGLLHELHGDEYWALEVEGQLVRHFGDNHHWEVNAILTGRWRAFPWNDTVPTSVAFGIGPSLASEVPHEERARSGDSAALLLYWMFEVEAGPADSAWSGVARLHHRSNGYGVFAERGGSNYLALGVRYRY